MLLAPEREAMSVGEWYDLSPIPTRAKTLFAMARVVSTGTPEFAVPVLAVLADARFPSRVNFR